MSFHSSQVRCKWYKIQEAKISQISHKKLPEIFLDPSYVFEPEENIKYPYNIGLWGSIETHDRIHQESYALRYDNFITLNLIGQGIW